MKKEERRHPIVYPSYLKRVDGENEVHVKFIAHRQSLTERLKPAHRIVAFFLSPHFTTILINPHPGLIKVNTFSEKSIPLHLVTRFATSDLLFYSRTTVPVILVI